MHIQIVIDVKGCIVEKWVSYKLMPLVSFLNPNKARGGQICSCSPIFSIYGVFPQEICTDFCDFKFF